MEYESEIRSTEEPIYSCLAHARQIPTHFTLRRREKMYGDWSVRQHIITLCRNLWLGKVSSVDADAIFNNTRRAVDVSYIFWWWQSYWWRILGGASYERILMLLLSIYVSFERNWLYSGTTPPYPAWHYYINFNSKFNTRKSGWFTRVALILIRRL